MLIVVQRCADWAQPAATHTCNATAAPPSPSDAAQAITSAGVQRSRREGSDTEGPEVLAAAPPDNSSACCCVALPAAVAGVVCATTAVPPAAEGAPGSSWWVPFDPVASEREGLEKHEPMGQFYEPQIILGAHLFCSVSLAHKINRSPVLLP